MTVGQHQAHLIGERRAKGEIGGTLALVQLDQVSMWPRAQNSVSYSHFAEPDSKLVTT